MYRNSTRKGSPERAGPITKKGGDQLETPPHRIGKS
jgi:hypothetical protein